MFFLAVRPKWYYQIRITAVVSVIPKRYYFKPVFFVDDNYKIVLPKSETPSETLSPMSPKSETPPETLSPASPKSEVVNQLVFRSSLVNSYDSNQKLIFSLR